MIALPIIAEKDYESFRKILSCNLTYTYDEWNNLLSNWQEDFKGARPVKINSNEFDRFLTATGSPAI